MLLHGLLNLRFRKQLSSHKENRVSFAPVKRISWNRSLSTRGRTSIAAAAACVDYRHQWEKPERKTKPVLPRDRSSKAERELRSLKKQLNNYGSAKEAADDPFFSDMLVGGAS